MFFYLIRHGHPDYTTDTLTEDGIREAKLVARRMKISGLDRIYASSMGRAMETASYTADILGLPVTVCDWARELGKESQHCFPDGKLKLMSNQPRSVLLAEEYRGLTNEEAMERVPLFTGNGFREKYKEISDGLDEMLRENGYSRNERGFYDVTEYSEKHIALFAHNGMGRVVLSHLLNIPYQYLGNCPLNHYTGVTVFYFDDGHRTAVPTPEYVDAHPEYDEAYELARQTNERIKRVGFPETLPFLASYGDIGHLYFDGEQPTYFSSKTKI